MGSPAQSVVVAACGRCGRSLERRTSFLLGEDVRCLRCAVRHLPMLRRSALTALVVGSVLTAINQGNVLVAGEFPAVLAWKIPLTYSVPFCVATWGGLVNSRRKASVAER